MGADHRRGHRAGRHRSFFLLNLFMFCGSILLYGLNEWVLKPRTGHAFFLGHFNDVLAMGLLLPYSNVLLGLYTGRDLRLLRLWPLLLFTLAVGVFWEVVTPLYYATSVGDPWDVLAYFVGGFLYYGLVRVCGGKAT